MERRIGRPYSQDLRERVVQAAAVTSRRQAATRFGIGIATSTRWMATLSRRTCEAACVQNRYNLAHRGDDALIDVLSSDGIADAPFFPLGRFSPLQSAGLPAVAERIGMTPLQVALAWLLCRSPDILLIPGTSSLAHLRENLAAATIDLPDDARADLDGIGAADPA